ncbi:hypothetical protein BH10PLA2_BH10PLA2_33430 [soil metagenome]
MSTPSELASGLKLALAEPTSGVLGLVEALLIAAREQTIQFRWKNGNCQIDIPSCEPAERIEMPLGKSVVRAVLARIAALCNERVADSVSPYAGHGEIAVDQAYVRVSFINNPDEQSLELSPTTLVTFASSEIVHSNSPSRR